MVRVGTSGGLQPFVPVGTYVAAGKSIGFDGVLYFYADSEKVRDKAFESELMRQLKWKLSGIQPYVVSADPSLVKQITQDDIIRGVTIAATVCTVRIHRSKLYPDAITLFFPRRHPHRISYALQSCLLQVHLRVPDSFFPVASDSHDTFHFPLRHMFPPEL